MRILGLTDEQRLELEQATGIKAVEKLLDAAGQQAQEMAGMMISQAIREVQSVVGPHGSVTRLQAGGVNISQGMGVGVFESGVLKTTIEPDGDFLAGSDITQPATTSFCVFVNEQVYNGETMGAGDLLIGDNSSGVANVKYDTSEGQLQFRSGETVQVYIDTDGSLKAGAGAVALDENGITFDVGDNGTSLTNAIKWDYLGTEYYRLIGYTLPASFSNILRMAINRISQRDGNFQLIVDSDTGNVSGHDLLSNINIETYKDGSNSGTARLVLSSVSSSNSQASLKGVIVQLGENDTSHTIILLSPVVFNEAGANMDFRMEGDTESNLFFLDASTDRIGIGTATPGYKLDVAGDINISSGSVFRVNGTQVLSGTPPAAEVNTNDIFRVNSPGGASIWTGTISGTPSGTSVTVSAPVTGTEGVLVPASTSQLAKMRLYNTTRSNSALISNYNTGTNVVTLTTNAPANWANGDSLTVASQTVSGGGFSWIDLEITSGPTGKSGIFVNLGINSPAAGDGLRLHPLDASFSVSKMSAVDAQVAGVSQNSGSNLVKITGNVFCVAWTANSTALLIREAGYL